MHHDEADLFTVNGVTDQELGLAAVTVCGEVWELEDIPYEEGVTPFLCPQIRPIDCGWLHCQPGPGFCHSSQLTCVLDRGSFQGGRQCLLRLQLSFSPNRRPSVPA